MSPPARDVVAGELDGALADRLAHADGVLAALTAAGYVVVPAGETRVERLLNRPDGPPMHRTVHYGPWEPVGG